ncbi:hypothetical protein [Actinacidiphila yeochonensis]|uniref:hypothetical protein n=1 Tax=Actinacidiphila yeochonensis TaxID=89050 RepID=UPI00056375E5|nr:hypothetical protein [Actinacidiphila yeochonensis]
MTDMSNATLPSPADRAQLADTVVGLRARLSDAVSVLDEWLGAPALLRSRKSAALLDVLVPELQAHLDVVQRITIRITAMESFSPADHQALHRVTCVQPKVAPPRLALYFQTGYTLEEIGRKVGKDPSDIRVALRIVGISTSDDLEPDDLELEDR